MVSNLLVVLCGDRSAHPVINAGTIRGPKKRIGFLSEFEVAARARAILRGIRAPSGSGSAKSLLEVGNAAGVGGEAVDRVEEMSIPARP